MTWYKNTTLLVVAAVLMGGGVGFAFSQAGLGQWSLTGILALPGQLWLKALKTIVLPMIVFAMIDAMIMMRSLPGAKSVGLSVIGWYMVLPTGASIEGCIAATLILGPNIGIDSPEPVQAMGGDQFYENVGDDQVSAWANDLPTTTSTAVEVKSLLDTIIGIIDSLIPGNILADAGNNYLLPVIMSSLVFGLMVRDKKPDGSKTAVLVVVGEMNKVVITIISMIMAATPIGVSSLVFNSASRLDLSKVGASVGYLILAVAAGLGSHFFLFYPTLIFFFGRHNPFVYYKNVTQAFFTALGTSSSAATLPVSIACGVEKNGLAPHIAKFVMSLGATIGMDGTAIYLICATYFLGTLQGFKFTMGSYITMSILAALTSAGSAPVPSASLILLATIMTAVGIEMNDQHFGLITAVDWMLDRLRTTVNVAGDQTVSSIIDRWYGQEAPTDGKEVTEFVEITKKRSSNFDTRGSIPN